MNLKEREPTRLTIPNKSLQDYGSMAIWMGAEELAMMMDPFTKDSFIKTWDKEEEEYSIQMVRSTKVALRPTS
jgi:hypothetical protein